MAAGSVQDKWYLVQVDREKSKLVSMRYYGV